MLRATRSVKQRHTQIAVSVVLGVTAAVAMLTLPISMNQSVLAAPAITEQATSPPIAPPIAPTPNPEAAQPIGQPANSIWESVEHGFANNDGVKIHYAALGKGPLVLFVHGFPDFWYSWRDQMAALDSDYRVVAIDQRGYNQSDAPLEEEAYDMRLLVSDVSAVIKHLGYDSATVVGHDWGGAVAWNFAFSQPDMLDRLVILNLPHPRGTAQSAADHPELRKNTQYAQKFRSGAATDPDIFFGGPMTPTTLAGWVRSDTAKPRYLEAFRRSSFPAMLNYYKRNYPPPPLPGAPLPETPPVNVPVLVFHGLEDQALPASGLNNTWDWVNADLTLVTVPGAGHFVQQDASDLVSNTMQWWLQAHP